MKESWQWSKLQLYSLGVNPVTLGELLQHRYAVILAFARSSVFLAVWKIIIFLKLNTDRCSSFHQNYKPLKISCTERKDSASCILMMTPTRQEGGGGGYILQPLKLYLSL